MSSKETMNELCRILEKVRDYCDGRVVWGNSDRERWEYVGSLAKSALKKANEGAGDGR